MTATPNYAVAPDANRCFTVFQEPTSSRAVRAGEPRAVGRRMMEDIERPFAARGVKRGGTLMFEAPVAYEVIEAARLAHQPVLGVDCFILTESTTMSPLEHILDLSRAVSRGVDTWSEARRFIEERESFGFFFEIVV